ncbi:FHA domain-containing protein [Butyrivibrio sp. NC2002]|uniref:FHA domain-containing protein n=1 Tax=Butyrivibrio sp. NC2002 TaxID=1410610 RepID=UPI0005600483|nr:FHA domain-containing protein [Butyrivibrio sp. NC2002]
MRKISKIWNKTVIALLCAGTLMSLTDSFSIRAFGAEDETEISDDYETEDVYTEEDDTNEAEGETEGEAEGESEEQEPVKVMQVRCDDSSVRAYITGVSQGDVSEYQIGNIPVENVSTYPITEDDNAARTLIMVDNSISIPGESREKVTEILKKIVSNASENELYRISTFSEDITYLSDKYTDDVTALNNMIDSISYADQETYLTDVLYDVVKEINTTEEYGYTRIVVISDGVDNKPIGVTREELNKELEDRTLPIYTIGVSTGKNADNLEGMFALSRVTGCDYCIMEETEVDQIASIIDKDRNLTVFKAVIPEDVKDGSLQNTKLTFTDGSAISFKALMPFSIKEKEEEVEVPPVIVEPEPEPEPTFFEKITRWIIANKLIFALIVTAVIAIIALLVIFVVRKIFNNRPGSEPQECAPTTPLNTYGKTEILGEAGDDGKTTRLTPNERPGHIKKIKLTTASDNSRTFRCEIEKEIKIGRMPDNDIVISDDTTVHGHHCTIECKDNAYFVTDLMNVKNHSSVNGIEIKPGFPQLIVTNSKLTIGRYTYVVSIIED